jgi:hypothetical protein
MPTLHASIHGFDSSSYSLSSPPSSFSSSLSSPYTSAPISRSHSLIPLRASAGLESRQHTTGRRPGAAPNRPETNHHITMLNLTNHCRMHWLQAVHTSYPSYSKPSRQAPPLSRSQISSREASTSSTPTITSRIISVPVLSRDSRRTIPPPRRRLLCPPAASCRQPAPSACAPPRPKLRTTSSSHQYG